MQKIAMAASAAFMALCACSCKDKKVDPIPDPIVFDDYTQLKIGNYWVYQLYDVDSLGNGPALAEQDSVSISGDTVINGNTYYYMSSTIPYSNNIWVRDSLHYLVNSYGAIMFSSQDFTTSFKSQPYFFDPGSPDTTAWLTKKMANKDALFTTPAGTFVTSDFQAIYDMYPPNDNAGTHRVLHNRYTKNIGIVSQTLPFYMNHPRYVEKRLIRYHLN